jgi:nitrate reductase molybdenum cofactor assembly chaperone
VTPDRIHAIGLAGRLLTYPAAGYADDLRAFRAVCADLSLDEASRLDALVKAAEESTVEGLQEMFTQTFDLTPSCALEVGWHLFGEDYQRGEFLARMRGALREHEIPEGSELPDHLASLLALVACSEPSTTDDLVRDALTPAVGKMLDGLEKVESIFSPLLRVVHQLLTVGPPASREVCRV